MSADDFKVGDRVRHTDGSSMGKVAGVHNDIIWVLEDGDDIPLTSEATVWRKVPTIPELWVNLHADGTFEGYRTKAQADNHRWAGRIALVHYRPDDPPEIITEGL